MGSPLGGVLWRESSGGVLLRSLLGESSGGSPLGKSSLESPLEGVLSRSPLEGVFWGKSFNHMKSDFFIIGSMIKLGFLLVWSLLGPSWLPRRPLGPVKTL